MTAAAAAAARPDASDDGHFDLDRIQLFHERGVLVELAILARVGDPLDPGCDG